MQERFSRPTRRVDITDPSVDQEGRKTFSHAVEVPYELSAYLWDRRSKELSRLGRNNYQIVVLEDNDVTQKIVRFQEEPFKHVFPIATVKETTFPDGEDMITIKNEAPQAKHIIIIASATTYKDILHIQEVAVHFKEDLNAEYVTLMAPYFMSGRSDKNCNEDESYRATPRNIKANIAALSYVDSFMIEEPHSFATQSAAADLEKPLFPISPWMFLTESVIGREIEIDNHKFVISNENSIQVRPDIGRNLAASRSAKHFGLDHVSFDKKRLSPLITELTLPVAERPKVKGKMCILYDDELSTNKTVGEIAIQLEEYGATGLIVIGVHAKFTGEWEDRIKNPFIKKVFITDSRVPIGNISHYIESGKIEVISLKTDIAQLLSADIEGINFWLNEKFNHLVLQTNKYERENK